MAAKDEIGEITIADEFYKNFLHGELVIQIVKAQGLVNTDHGVKAYGFHNFGRCISIDRACTFYKNLSDPFVSIYLGECCLCQTSWKSDKYASQNIGYCFELYLEYNVDIQICVI